MVMMRFVELIYAMPDMLVILLLSTVLKPALINYQSSGEGVLQSLVGLLGPNLIAMFIAFALMPAKRFGLGGGLKVGAPADLTVFDLKAEYTVDSDNFLSMGRATPFEGERVFGKCLMTMCAGVPVWNILREAAL